MEVISRPNVIKEKKRKGFGASVIIFVSVSFFSNPWHPWPMAPKLNKLVVAIHIHSHN